MDRQQACDKDRRSRRGFERTVLKINNVKENLAKLFDKEEEDEKDGMKKKRSRRRKRT